ncbi:alanine--tRNA ligase [Saccharomycopsis crataegensis]|uniref:Alanine--tRNA ligase n=1 Tax=Saccharomycopsis crataegensis TaxID=43959 RepID=A0AAV5QUI2_9ASCO|nr:alanine--tRNA ligase [Saccharomycopsis crataegensis]
MTLLLFKSYNTLATITKSFALQSTISNRYLQSEVLKGLSSPKNTRLPVNPRFFATMSSEKPSTSELASKWNATTVRNTFLKYFEDKLQHNFVKSSPVVPFDDPTLLFANAGMNQYKPIFLGTVDPSSSFYTLKRAVNSQKCIRAGGKHNDLEDVGKDSYHHTFFEMLGNWSFGDYFKDDAVPYAWNLLTKVYGLDPDRLYVTYFGGDEKLGLAPDLEAKKVWEKVGVKEDHILPGNTQDNFWEMGDQGPCGPCSEIHYDRIGGRNAASLVNMDDPDVLEIWNIVFIQFNRVSATELRPLPAKHIDTGMGFERLVSVLQDVRSNYDTDVFIPLFEKIQELTGVRSYAGKFAEEDKDGIDTAYRVLADHVRTLAFAISDGGVPNNEGRGYVLRRILRRGARYARKYMGYPIGEKPFFSLLFPTLMEQMNEIFPELKKNEKTIIEILNDEELSFAKTLDRGEKLFETYATAALKTESKTLNGKDVWRLYDTYGFPVDLTQLMAEEAGLKIDETGFEKAKKESYEASKAGGAGNKKEMIKLDVYAIDKLHKEADVAKTNDSFKYTTNGVDAKVLAIYNGSEFLDSAADEGMELGVVLDKTSFYAESGGQEYDTGVISSPEFEFEVSNVQLYGGYVLHTGKLVKGSIKLEAPATATFDDSRRLPIKNNHTGTHVLNYGLREVLGDGIDQKGSLVTPEKLRFDFSHNKGLTLDEIAKVEKIVNAYIEADNVVYYKDVQLDLAQKISGLRAVFGETYPNPVRVVSIGVPVDELLANPENPEWSKYSVEFCGGTHVNSTKVIKQMVVIEESGIAKGIRRMVVVSGEKAFEVQKIAGKYEEELSDLEKMSFGAAKEKKIKELGVEIKKLSISMLDKESLKTKFAKIDKAYKDELKKIQKEQSKKVLDEVKAHFAAPENAYFVKYLDLSANAKLINECITFIKKSHKDKSLYLILGDKSEGKLAHGCYISNEAIAKGVVATEAAGVVSKYIGGKAGGKGNTCQGMGTEFGHIDEAVEELSKLFSEKL